MKKYNKLFGEDWAELLKDFLDSKEFKSIGKQIMNDFNNNKTIYPSFDTIFRAFRECPLEKTMVVFLTHNVYLNGEGDGLAFSAKKFEFISNTPPILTKIHDSVEKDSETKLNLDRSNDLTPWANQGVLLLNMDLTVQKGKIKSHLKLWKPFIDHVIEKLRGRAIIWVLIGSEALKYEHQLQGSGVDVFKVEHPIKAVMEKRPWKHKNIFGLINRVCNMIHDREVMWFK